MSTVRPSDQREKNDRVRQTREEYEAREADLAKRKAAELKRMQEQHNREMKEIQDNYESRIGSLKSRTRDLISDRDQENQKNIEELRSMYKDQLKKKTYESDEGRRSQAESFRSALDKEKSISDLQKQSIVQRFQNELSEKDELYSDNVEETKNVMKESLTSNRDRLNQTHQKEMNHLNRSKDDLQIRNAQKMMEMKNYYDSKLTGLKKQQESLENKWQDRYAQALTEGADRTNDQHLELSQQMMGQREELKSNYQRQLRDREKKAETILGHYEGEIGERMNSKVRSKNYQINQLEDRLAKQTSRAEKQKQIEKKNLVSTYENRLVDLQEQNEEGFHALKDLNAERMTDSKVKNDKMLGELNKYYKGEISLKNLKHKIDRENLEMQKQERVNFVETTAEKHINRTEMTAQQRVSEMEKYFEEAKEVMRQGYSEKINHNREKQLETSAQMNKAMTERFRNIEKKFREKFDFTVNGYETKISQMKEEHDKEMKRLENDFKRKSTDQQKGIKVEKQTLEGQFESRISMIQDQHRQEVERMSRRHEQDMQDLTVKMNSYSRKA